MVSVVADGQRVDLPSVALQVLPSISDSQGRHAGAASQPPVHRGSSSGDPLSTDLCKGPLRSEVMEVSVSILND